MIYIYVAMAGGDLDLGKAVLADFGDQGGSVYLDVIAGV